MVKVRCELSTPNAPYGPLKKVFFKINMGYIYNFTWPVVSIKVVLVIH